MVHLLHSLAYHHRNLSTEYFLSISEVGWTAIAAMATTLAVLVALFGEKLWAYLRRPIPIISYDQNSDRCYRFADVLNDVIQELGLVSRARRQYFRLKIHNSGKTTLHNLKIKVELFDGGSNDLADRFEPSTLGWITGEEKISLAPNESNYANLISQVLEPAVIQFPIRIEIFNKTPRGISWDKRLAQYRLQVVIHADNLTESVEKYYYFTPSIQTGTPGSISEIPTP